MARLRRSCASNNLFSGIRQRMHAKSGSIAGLTHCLDVNKESPHMKFFASALFGAVALAGAALTTVPAEARSGVAIQIGPGGFAIGVNEYREYCRDYRYRHRYSDYCNRYRYDDAYYSDRGEYYQWNMRHHRHHRHHRYDRYNDRYDDRYDNDRYDNDRRYDDRYDNDRAYDGRY